MKSGQRGWALLSVIDFRYERNSARYQESGCNSTDINKRFKLACRHCGKVWSFINTPRAFKVLSLLLLKQQSDSAALNKIS